MVAYIYSYNNGSKCKNTGFAKIEIRRDVIKLQINMKGAYSEIGVWNVSFFYREQDKIIGIKLGEMAIKDGLGEFRYTGNALNVEGEDCEFSKIKGIYIWNNSGYGKMWASEWDDLGFCPDKIGEKQPEYVELLEAAEIAEVVEESASDTEIVEERTGIEGFFEGRNKVFLFADDDLYDCVEVSIDDIEQLPDTNWALKNNSFVNHGYYSFRHLIVGKTSLGNGCGYFIGVPGLYTRRDRNTAAMFGFNHFKFSMRSDVRLSQFGYWYKSLDVN